MSGMADACFCPSIPRRENPIAHKTYLTLKSSGIAITITSLTDVLAFGIGATSEFLSVKNFCITTGKQIFLFSVVPGLNGKRTASPCQKENRNKQNVSRKKDPNKMKGQNYFKSKQMIRRVKIRYQCKVNISCMHATTFKNPFIYPTS